MYIRSAAFIGHRTVCNRSIEWGVIQL